MIDRPFDVILYGASGFVGQQTVAYFACHPQIDRVRWAIAGRNRAKLEAVCAKFAPGIEVLVADSQDQSALDALAAQTAIVLSTAGPFARYSDKLVTACVNQQTHYVDITGETPWVKSLIDRYHAQAAATGTRIIPCCGFDSVPSDLGTYLLTRHSQEGLGVPCQSVKAYFQAFGGFNGGTLASGLNILDSGQAATVSQPFLLNPPGEIAPETLEQNRDPLLPAYDADIGTWVAPFFMGPVNTRIVRRSCALSAVWQPSEHGPQGYGSDFTYQEYLKFDSPLGWLQATGLTAATALALGIVQTPLRQLIEPLLPQPGEGPTEEVMDNGWFRCELLGETSDGRKLRGLIADRGDPGNRATVKFVCESALSLVLNAEALPGGSERGGILTPATGLGEVLAERLRQAGMTVEVEFSSAA